MLDKHVNTWYKGVRYMPQAQYEDPTYLGFKLIFDFNPIMDLETGLTTSPLFAPADGSGLESAQAYLSAIGYKEKARMIAEFGGMLKWINQNTPYYFQSIEGVAELWKFMNGDVFDPFRANNKVLTINCLEGIDMRITAMADLHRKATRDDYMRSMLPPNMQEFSMYLMVAEMRKMHSPQKNDSPKQEVNNSDGSTTTVSDNKMILTDAGNIISVLTFKLSKCKFDFEESFPITETINMGSEMVMANQKFKIKVGHIKEENIYPIHKLVLKEGEGKGKKSLVYGTHLQGDSNIPTENFDMPLGKAQGFNPTSFGAFDKVNSQLSDIKRRAEVAIPNAVARLGNKLDERISGLILGNVYKRRAGAIFDDIFNSGRSNKPGAINLGDAYKDVPGKDLGLPDRNYRKP
jgi:hypothetical protein